MFLEEEKDKTKSRFKIVLRKDAEQLKMNEYKSNWDQFCDFTSLVGFRLLHSKNSLWIRFKNFFVYKLILFF